MQESCFPITLRAATLPDSPYEVYGLFKATESQCNEETRGCVGNRMGCVRASAWRQESCNKSRMKTKILNKTSDQKIKSQLEIF